MQLNLHWVSRFCTLILLLGILALLVSVVGCQESKPKNRSIGYFRCSFDGEIQFFEDGTIRMVKEIEWPELCKDDAVVRPIATKLLAAFRLDNRDKGLSVEEAMALIRDNLSVYQNSKSDDKYSVCFKGENKLFCDAVNKALLSSIRDEFLDRAIAKVLANDLLQQEAKIAEVSDRLDAIVTELESYGLKKDRRFRFREGKEPSFREFHTLEKLFSMVIGSARFRNQITPLTIEELDQQPTLARELTQLMSYPPLGNDYLIDEMQEAVDLVHTERARIPVEGFHFDSKILKRNFSNWCTQRLRGYSGRSKSFKLLDTIRGKINALANLKLELGRYQTAQREFEFRMNSANYRRPLGEKGIKFELEWPTEIKLVSEETWSGYEEMRKQCGALPKANYKKLHK